jgi:N-acylglucosamine 2-epimerase/mannose-6-phosphate isomerase
VARALSVQPFTVDTIAQSIQAKVHRWLFEEALPFWARSGVDRVHGGYVEQLRLDGTDQAVDFKRTRVVSRQIYVFSHAALLGHADGLALARHGYDFLTQKAWLGPQHGWARQLDRAGRIKDPTPDLYDHAFALFAFGWYYRASRDPEALWWAVRTLEFINDQMRHPGGIGFLHEKPAVGPRLQNPHMHLLEASLVNLEATGRAEFRDLADDIVELFCTRLFDPSTGTLSEYFNEDWSRASGDAGRITEPGHQFEWAWILAAYQRASGSDMRDYVRALTTFAEAYGVDPASRITFSSVRNDGVVLNRGSRVWPNTERIQAAVAMFELIGLDPRPVFQEAGHLLFSRFLCPALPGTWIDQIGPEGAPQVDRIPASTLYHLWIAFTEMLRVEAAVARAFQEPDESPPLQEIARRSRGHVLAAAQHGL